MESVQQTSHKLGLLDLIKGKAEGENTHQECARLRHEFTDKPLIFIGTGTCGRIAGAMTTLDKIEQYLEEKSIDATIIEVGCIGLCSAEPLVDIQLPGKSRLSYKNITSEKVTTILDDTFNNRVTDDYILAQFPNNNLMKWDNVPFINELNFFRKQRRIVLDKCGIIDPENIASYVAHKGYKAFAKTIQHYTSEEVINLISDSGLRGRGGGGYPTAKKWKVAYNTTSNQKYLICNADESDPGSFMDRAVIEGDPHKLIEGMAIAAYAIGANKAIIYIRSEYTLAVKRLTKAIEQAKELGLIGENILDSGTNIFFQIQIGAGAFICGEETALINSIEGKRGSPRPKPPYPAERGLYGKPTVVNNVETLANIRNIINNGPDWFKTIGTENSKGTKVFAISGKTINTGLIEVEMGTSLYDIIYDIGDGIKNEKEIKSIQIGGASGACIAGDNLDIIIDYEELQNSGAMMGSGGMVVMDEDTCMVDVAKFFMQFLSNESCGKCIPCREGTRRMLEILENITRKPKEHNQHESLERFRGVMMLEQLGKVIKETSLCGLGQTAPNPVLSALRLFREEFEEHIYERKMSCKCLHTTPHFSY